MHADLAKHLSMLIEDAQSIGLFLVPVGELENWLANENIPGSKRTKWAWANDASAQVRQLGNKGGDVWEFMEKIGTYLLDSRARN